jgi:hypothetical protein
MYGLETESQDVVTAYLYAPIDHEIYMKVPAGYQDDKAASITNPVVRVQKSIYGLKQSGLMWYLTMKDCLLSKGFVNHETIPCIFIKREGTEFVIIALYVDDLTIFGTRSMVFKIKEEMEKRFEMKDLGKLSLTIGLQVEHNPNGIFVHQTNYTNKLLKKYSMENCNAIRTPMEVRGERELYYAATDGDELEDVKPYQKAIGELQWLALKTRPDISYAVATLSRHSARPTLRHWQGIKRLLAYLKGKPDVGLLYRRNDTSNLKGFVDAGYKCDPDTGRSQAGYIFKMCGAAISWRSKKNTVVATSTAHAEIIALYEGTRQAYALKSAMDFIGESTGLYSETKPIVIHEDNEACIAQVQRGYSRTDATKHIDPKYIAWVAQENGTTVNVQPIASAENTADVFTKALPRVTHEYHVKGLGLVTRHEFIKVGDEGSNSVMETL